VPAVGFAQEPATSDQGAQAPAPKVSTTIVVTATRSESEVDRTPISASVITPAEIAARPVQSLDQQLTLTEGVYVQRNQGFSATDSHVALRGFNTTSRTLVLVDGQPFNDAYAGSVNWTGLPSGQVERIEVVRGPFSSLYGGNALGGVINIRTRPITRRAFDGSAEYGSFESHRIGGFFSDRFGGRLGVSAGFEHFATDGYNSRRFTATPGTGTGTLVTGPIPTQTSAGAAAAIVGEGGRNALNRKAARLKADYQMGSATVLSLQYLRTDYEYRYEGYHSYLRDATGATIDSGAVVYDDNGVRRRLSVTPNSFLQGPGEQHSNFYSGTFEHAFTSGAALHVDAGVYVIPTFQFRTLGGGNTLTSGPGTLTDGNRHTSHANVHYTRTVQRHQLTFGGETRHEMAENNQFPLANWTDKDARGNQSYLAAGRSINQSGYVQDEIALADNLRLVVGARYDYWRAYDGVSDSFSALAPLTPYPTQTRHQASGKAALGYTLPGEWHLRVSAGNAFRNPNVFDLYATSVSGGGITFAANPSLTPETVKSWEAGVRHRFATGTSVDAAYYENRIKDLIYRQADLTVDPSGNYRINMNAGQGRTRGVEFSVRQPIVEGFEFRTTYSYTDAIITDNPGNPAIVGKHVTFIPDHMASVQLLGRRGPWNGSLAGHYTGRLFSTDTNTDTTKGVPGSYSPFFTMDASASYEITRRVQPFVTFENLLDRRYYVFYLSPGRTVFGGVRVRL
jgi:iron complex outermembrane receptor protein